MSVDARPTPTPTPDGPRLTDQQRRPLEVLGASVALSAGAGCGKTTVLTSRFLIALESSPTRALGSVVALTFTEKAARELRHRIRESCHRRLESAPDDQSGFWRATLRGLEAAPVSTFHEYCGKLLRRHALAAGLDPEFEVLDAAIAGSIRDETLSRSLRRWLAEPDPDLVETAVEFGLGRVRALLGDLVAQRDASSLAHWVDRTEDDLIAAWRDAWVGELVPAATRRLLDAARACAESFARQDFTVPKLVEFRRTLLESLDIVERHVDDDIWLSTLRESAKVPGGLRIQQWPSPESNKEAKRALEEFRSEIDALLEARTWDEPASRLAASHGLRLARLAADARREFDAAKLARGGLDFDDLLVKTRDLLRDPTAAAAVLGSSDGPVEFLLVDEFQDTDPVQSEVLRLLAGEGFAVGRMFVVGDYKQSIYRFRGARPRIFHEFRSEFPEAGRLDLSENFRSNAAVLDVVNALFAEAFPGESPRLLPGPNAQPASNEPSVDFIWAEEPGDDPKARTSVHERRQVEARWLARWIRDRLDAGWLVRDRRAPGGPPRRANAGDVAFLFRAMTDVGAYEQALATEGLDFYVVGGSGFFALQEVQDVVNVLSVVEDPLDAVSLAGALRSPFFGLSDDGLLGLGGAGAGLGSLAERFLSDEVDPRTTDDDRARLDRARTLFARWWAIKDRTPLATLLDRVLDESGYEAALLGEFLGDRKRANARKLVRLARRFDARGGFTLADLVAHLRADLRDATREEQAATSDEEGENIRLMSIHQAKGLEFPIVVVPDLNRRSSPSRSALAFDPELGPLVRLGKAVAGAVESEGEAQAEAGAGGSGQSLGWAVFQARESIEDTEESLRLFYVAATRARDALVLSAGVGPEARPASPAMKLLDARFDRRDGRCKVALPEGWGEPVVRVTSEPPAGPAGPRPERPSRPDLAAISGLISATATPRGAPDLLEPRRPHWIDLDRARGLSPIESQLDRLARAVLNDPQSLRTGRLRAAAVRAARRQVPVVSPARVEEVVKRLARGLAGAIGERIASAVKIERGSTWTVTWPPSGSSPCRIRGWTDLLVCDGAGVWNVIQFSTPGAPDAWERLRWVLAARVAQSRGVGTIGPGWRVTLADPPLLRRERGFDSAVVEEALEQALRSIDGASPPES